MTPDEIVKALRCCGNTNTKRPDCEHCPANGHMCVKHMLEGAADLIESLQANLVSKTMELFDLREAIRIKGGTEHAPTEYAFFTVCAVVRKLHAQLSEKTALLDATIAGQETLQRALAESQRRERAAVEDLEGAGACFTCKHFRRNGGDCFGAGRCRLDGIEIWPCNEPGGLSGGSA